MGIEYINITQQEFLDKTPLFKIISLEYAMESLKPGSQYFWFANPSTWKDPFESRFLRAQYVDGTNTIQTFPLVNKIFCCCFTPVRTMEPQWKMYSTKKSANNVVRLTIEKEKFIEELKLLCQEGNRVFIGKVEYQATKIIEGSVHKNPFFMNCFDLNSFDTQIRLMLLKRNAYMYENEIRIFIIPPKVDGIDSKGFKFKYKCSSTKMISRITLGPEFSDSTAGRIFETAMDLMVPNTNVYGYGFTPIIDSLGRKHPRVVKSQLYKQSSKTIKIKI